MSEVTILHRSILKPQDFLEAAHPWVVLSREVGDLRPSLQRLAERSRDGQVSATQPGKTADFRDDLQNTVAEITKHWQATLACGRADPVGTGKDVVWLTELARSQAHEVASSIQKTDGKEPMSPAEWLALIAKLKWDIQALSKFLAASGQSVSLSNSPMSSNLFALPSERYELVATHIRAEADEVLRGVLEKSTEAALLLEKSRKILDQVNTARAELGEVTVLKRLKELGKDLRVRSRYLKLQQRASTGQAYYAFGITAAMVVLTIFLPKFGEPIVDLTWRAVISLAGFSVGYFHLRQAGAYRRMSFIVDHRRQNAELYRSVLSEGLPAEEERVIRAKLLDRLARDPQFDVQKGSQDDDLLDVLKGIASRCQS